MNKPHRNIFCKEELTSHSLAVKRRILPIRSVMVGPTHWMADAVRLVPLLLRKTGYSDAAVTKTRIELRP